MELLIALGLLIIGVVTGGVFVRGRQHINELKEEKEARKRAEKARKDAEDKFGRDPNNARDWLRKD